MIDYQKLVSHIPNIENGDLFLTNSYDFAGVLTKDLNLIYINKFKNFNMEGIYQTDWIVATDEIEYVSDFSSIEKGICCLEQNLLFLNPDNLKHLYHDMGLYVYKIVVLDDEDYKYFIILKKRCCTKCNLRANACCPNAVQVEEPVHTHSEKKYERFDFYTTL